MPNSIQSVGNSLYDANNQDYTSNLNEISNISSNSFVSVMEDVQNSKSINNSFLSSGIANVPMGFFRESSSSNTESIDNSINTVIEDSSSIINNVSSYIEVTNKNATQKEQIEDAVRKASEKYGIDENLIKAVIKTESNFNPNAVSSAGAKGLMQVMPSNYKSLGISNPFDIYQNVDGGTKLLREYLDKYNGDVEMALMAYNGGPTRMKNRGVTSINDIYKMPKETQNYVKKVMGYYRGE